MEPIVVDRPGCARPILASSGLLIACPLAYTKEYRVSV